MLLDKENQYRANTAQEDDWIYFMRHIAEWGWLHAFVRLNDDSLVVASNSFIRRLKKVSDNYKCTFITPDALDSKLLGEYTNVLVFLLHGELQIVQELRKRYPAANIVSATHEFSTVTWERAARLEVKRAKPKSVTRRPVVFLSRPNTGAEYFAEIMRRNNLIQPWEYIGRPLITLSKLIEGFDFFEMVKSAEKRYESDDGMAYLFQMDVLNALFDRTSLTPQKFVAWVKEQGAYVVSFHQGESDRFHQACITGLLKSTYNRSIWTMKKLPSFSFKLNQADCQNVHDALMGYDAEEGMLTRLCNELPAVHRVQVEAAVQDITSSMKEITSYLELKLPEEPELLDYKSSFWHKPEMQMARTTVRRALIDRLGLHIKPFPA